MLRRPLAHWALAAAAAIARALAAATSVSESNTAEPASRWRHLALYTRDAFVVDAQGEPFFWQGDTAWELFHRLNRSEVVHYLDDRKAKGFNVIMTVAIPELNVTAPNRYGELPLVDLDPTKPNPKYFANVDWCIDRATERGLRVAIVPTWGRYVNGGWHGPPILFNATNAAVYGEWFGRHYAGLPKIVGADSDRWWPTNITAYNVARAKNAGQATDVGGIGQLPFADTGDVWEALVGGLLKAEKDTSRGGPSVDAFVTYHPTNQWLAQTPAAMGSSSFPNASWLKMDAVQSGHESIGFLPGTGRWDAQKNYVPVEIMYNSSLHRKGGRIPVQDLENHYEGGYFNIDATSPRIWNASDVRNGAWTAIFSGAAGATYGAWSVWQFWNPALYAGVVAAAPWQEQLVLPGSGQFVHVQNLLTNKTLGPGKYYFDRVPDNTLVASTLGEGEERVSATRDAKGRWAAVYAPQGESFQVNLTRLGAAASIPGKATWTERWYDPRTGEFGEQKRQSAELKGAKTYQPPSRGGIDHDWVLLIDSLH